MKAHLGKYQFELSLIKLQILLNSTLTFDAKGGYVAPIPHPFVDPSEIEVVYLAVAVRLVVFHHVNIQGIHRVHRFCTPVE